MIGHIKALSKIYKVTVIANQELGSLDTSIPVDFIHLPIRRDISLIHDVMCVFKLCVILNRGKFDAVHSITPKAGLLGMLSSFFCGIKNRFHTFTGQVWVTRVGLPRAILKCLDKITASLTSFSLVDSPSQREFLISEKVVGSSYSKVLGCGSISGVDLSRFKYTDDERSTIRNSYDIPSDAFVFIFLGRLCVDKGINELIESFCRCNESFDCYLMLVGPNESNYNKDYFDRINNNNIVVCGLTNKPESYFSASDVFVLPSYREGFGTTVIEAAACGIPTLASNIYGLSDAVENHSTGLLHEVKNVEELTEHMNKLVSNRNLSNVLGRNANLRANEYFSADFLSNELVKFYEEHVGV